MRRTRLVLLIWTIVMISLFGAWGHSLFRKTMVRYNRVSMERQFTLGIVAGSVEITWSRITGKGPNRLRAFIFPLDHGAVHGGAPDYRFGRFFHRHVVVGTPANPYFKTTLEFPLWTLLVLFTILSLPLYLHYRKRQRLHPAEIIAEHEP